MKIIADENIPLAMQAFGVFGMVSLYPAEKINNEILKEADVLIVRSVTKVNEKLLENTKIKFVGTATIGTDHVDKKYLKKQKIKFASAPGCNADSVANWWLNTILILAKKYKKNIEKLTVGIIGHGNVGKKIEKICHDIGCKVVINDPIKKNKYKNIKKYIDIDELLNNADVITIHVPLIKKGKYPTENMVNKKFLEKIKENAWLINSARGQVVVENDLIDYRKYKNLKIALDVWKNEPEINKEILENTDLASPHIAGYSLDGKVNGTKIIFQKLNKALGKKYKWKNFNFQITNTITEIEKINHQEKNIDILENIINKIVKMENTDKELRKINKCPKENIGKYFSSLRKNYHIRRDFKNISINIKKNQNDHKIIKILKNLGFKINKID